MLSKRSSSTHEINEAKKVIIEVGLKCWQKGWVAANDGNITHRISENEILCTPTGVSKGMLTMEHICMVNMKGEVLGRCPYKPSSEIKMHLRVMKERPDVNSVFHAHPPYATAHAIAGIPLAECVVPEIIIGLGSIPIAPYGTPSTDEIPDRLLPLIKEHDAWLLENHGALTAGKDPYQSFYRMESLELYAKMMYIARGLGNINPLNSAQVQTLINLRKQFGVENKNNVCTQCGACGKPRLPGTAPYSNGTQPSSASPPAALSGGLDEGLVDAIVQRVKEALLRQQG
jgi:L-fuculose-phosphate aldolase